MAILCGMHPVYGSDLLEQIRAGLPEEDVRDVDQVGDPGEIDVCMLFRMAPGALEPFHNLKLISATGAGVDHYLLDPALPRDIPLVRIVDRSFAAMMADYVLSWVMFHHRGLAQLIENQRYRRWAFQPMRPASEVPVGVMGLGQMGSVTAERLVALGYDVRGWARTDRNLPGMTCFGGTQTLDAFLDGTEILVNLLPLTAETRGILCQRTFATMRPGGVVISAGRGGHLVEQDLCEALDTGVLRAATIDALPQEPLPADHRLWDQRNLYVTPHCSSTASCRTIVDGFCTNVRHLRAGEPLLNRVDFARGY